MASIAPPASPFILNRSWCGRAVTAPGDLLSFARSPATYRRFEKSGKTQAPNTELPTYNLCQQVMLTYTSFLALEREYKGVSKSDFDAGAGSSNAVEKTEALLSRGKWSAPLLPPFLASLGPPLG